MTEIVFRIVLDDYEVKMHKVSDIIGISNDSVHRILIEEQNSHITVLSAGKIISTVFCDCQAIIFVDYLDKGRTINAEFYASLLLQLCDKITEKLPYLAKEKMVFRQNNVPAYKSAVTMAAKIEWIDIRISVSFALFGSNSYLIGTVSSYFKDLNSSTCK